MRFRDPKQNGDPPPEYGSSGNMFTMCIHTGGSVHSGIDYVGGNIYKFDHVKRDLFSIDSLKKFAGYMDGNEIEVLYTKNDEGQFEQINTESEYEKCSGKAVSEGKELEIYILNQGKRDSDVGGGSDSDNSHDSGFVLGNELASANCDFVDNKDNIEEGSGVSEDMDEDNIEKGTGVGEDSIKDVEVFDDGSGDDDVGESDDDFDSVEDYDSENEGPIYQHTAIHDPHLELSMIFNNKMELIDAVHLNAVLNKRVIKITKNDRSRVYARCQGHGCEWRVSAMIRPGDGTFKITTYMPTHSCPESYHVKSLKPRLLSRKYGYLFKSDPSRRVTEIKKHMSSKLGVHITVHQAYRCRRLALEDQYDNVDEQYMLLWDYAQEIRRTNPGSTVLIDSDESSGRFDRMYMCLNAVKQGFLIGCRPLIGVDGCHLRGPHQGVLLSAVGVDPNNNIFPIAYAVVSKEDGDTWEWFLSVLKVDLKIEDDTCWTFISDKQEGLVRAIQNVFPNTSHRFCVRRLHSDFRNAGFSGQTFKMALYGAAKATTVDEFNRKKNDMIMLNKLVVQWLNDTPPQHWSRSHFNCIPKCDILMNNPCESYKRSILPGREMPILSMLEWLMEHLMKRFQENRDRAHRGIKWKGVLCPRIQKQIHESMKHIGGCIIPLKDNDEHYQVTCTDGSQYSVDLEKWTCGCRKWDLTGIPCIHALRVIDCQGLNPEDFTHACYRVSTYRMVYDPCIMPINGRSEWARTELFMPLLPPEVDRSAGRPQKAITAGEKQNKRLGDKPSNNPYRVKRNQVTLRCSNCHEYGHNKRKCESLYLGEEEEINEDVQTVNLLEPPPMHDQLLQSHGSGDDDHVIKKTRKRYVTRSCRKSTADRVDQTPGGNSQVISDDDDQTVNLQLLQRQRTEDDDHVIKTTEKKYATRSSLASFTSGNKKSTVKRVDQTPGDNSQVINDDVPDQTVNLQESPRQRTEDDDHIIKTSGKKYSTRSYLASFASGNEKSKGKGRKKV
ncbi:hypothetical protein ACS0TY_013818 [Phlomoides rotata]